MTGLQVRQLLLRPTSSSLRALGWWLGLRPDRRVATTDRRQLVAVVPTRARTSAAFPCRRSGQARRRQDRKGDR